MTTEIVPSSVTGPVETHPVETRPTVSRPIDSLPVDTRPFETLPPVAEMVFVSPQPGQTLQVEGNNTFEVRAVPGAVAYTFAGSQFGRQILNVQRPAPSLTLVDPKPSYTPNYRVQAGKFTMSVTAADATGRVMAEGSVTVVFNGPSPITLPPITVSRPVYSSP